MGRNIPRAEARNVSKPIVSVINNDPRLAINANDPVVILTTEIELQEASKLLISGVINGTFYYVCGIALLCVRDRGLRERNADQLGHRQQPLPC